MLLLIAKLLHNSKNWNKCTVRLFVVTALPENASENILAVAREYLDSYRLL